jgi:hypothetical protein
MVGSPVLFYLAVKLHLDFALSAIGALIIGIIGFVLIFSERAPGAKKAPQQKQPISSDVVTQKPAPEKTAPEQKA